MGAWNCILRGPTDKTPSLQRPAFGDFGDSKYKSTYRAKERLHPALVKWPPTCL